MPGPSQESTETPVENRNDLNPRHEIQNGGNVLQNPYQPVSIIFLSLFQAPSESLEQVKFCSRLIFSILGYTMTKLKTLSSDAFVQTSITKVT